MRADRRIRRRGYTLLEVLLASVIAGILWQLLGPAATFIAGAVFASIASAGVLAYRQRRI